MLISKKNKKAKGLDMTYTHIYHAIRNIIMYVSYMGQSMSGNIDDEGYSSGGRKQWKGREEELEQQERTQIMKDLFQRKVILDLLLLLEREEKIGIWWAKRILRKEHKRLLELLVKLGIVEIVKVDKSRIVVITEKGKELARKLREILELLIS